MVVVFPSTGFAATPAGMLSPTGKVLVDSRPCDANTAIFDGDSIVTRVNSAAFLQRPGMTVQLKENSSVVVRGNTLDLDSGTSVVSSTIGSRVRVLNLTISTAPGWPGKYLVRRTTDQLQVLAMAGTVSVSDGQNTTPVPAAQGVNIPLPSPSSAGGTVSKGARWLANDDIGMLIVVATAIAAGVSVGVYNAQNASPKAP